MHLPLRKDDTAIVILRQIVAAKPRPTQGSRYTPKHGKYNYYNDADFNTPIS